MIKFLIIEKILNKIMIKTNNYLFKIWIMVIFLIKDLKNIDFSKSPTNINPNDL